MERLMVDPRAFLAAALAQEGRPYVWGRKGPIAFDCSGLVTWALREAGGPDWRYTHNSQSLWGELAPLERPAPGEVALAAYGFPSHPAVVHHVMVVTGDGRAFGACGGDSSTTTLAAAKLRGAKVQFRSSPGYRFDLLGFRRLALKEVPSGRPTA